MLDILDELKLFDLDRILILIFKVIDKVSCLNHFQELHPPLARRPHSAYYSTRTVDSASFEVFEPFLSFTIRTVLITADTVRCIPLSHVTTIILILILIIVLFIIFLSLTLSCCFLVIRVTMIDFGQGGEKM